MLCKEYFDKVSLDLKNAARRASHPSKCGVVPTEAEAAATTPREKATEESEREDIEMIYAASSAGS